MSDLSKLAEEITSMNNIDRTLPKWWYYPIKKGDE